ncbi:hypothetical protein OBBRIDRAFT_791692 [Obba rivulosa]|uniref:Uncharacterized protein n=1 Tax=Obba rivulosa TaxID=1052685 RepID=A0A8E2AXD5_9APHY|nr:hypothetical protein OBBRIDRAFT_791692 [Obba rivulosa]
MRAFAVYEHPSFEKPSRRDNLMCGLMSAVAVIVSGVAVLRLRAGGFPAQLLAFGCVCFMLSKGFSQ